MRRIAPLLLAAAALAGCTSAPGTGWSRASDLSVYGGMHVYARAALDQEVLCGGFGPGPTLRTWELEFGARQAAVTGAMSERYGPETLARARAVWAPSVACRELADQRWRSRYERQLRLLEIRLGLIRQRGG